MAQQQQQAEALHAPRRRDPGIAPVAAPPGMVRVTAGAEVQDMALAGHTVGQARAIAETLFGIAPGTEALVDAHTVGDAHVLEAGERLEFTKASGRKGAPRRAAPADRAQMTGAVLEMAGGRVTWRRNGTALGETSVGDLLARVATRGQPPASWQLYPPLVRLMVPRGRGARGEVTAVVIEMPPGPRRVRWIADASEDPLGAAGAFEERTLGFPWIVLVIVFAHGELTGLQQAFYRRAPIETLDDPLCYTNLLNVADGYDQESWVCLVELRHALGELSWTERIRRVTDHFWHAAFTRSSEVHEGNSHWRDRRGVDPRVADLDSWERATRENPYFALDVPWQPTPRSLGVTLREMLEVAAPWRDIVRVDQLVTLMQQGAS
jgi:hypothetical protein